jgi:UDP-N-acetylmuramate dehydrogenase
MSSFETRLQSGKRLGDYSTFGIGGPARYFFEARSFRDLEDAFAWVRSTSVPYFILGKGSNCLFDDLGFDGLVIRNKIDFCEMEDQRVHVGAGASFSLLGKHTARRGLSGLEFACGIPGTVGGAIFMNAGANGQETSTCLHDVLFLSESGDQRKIFKEELSFAYRTSPFQKLRGALLSACFFLHRAPEAHGTQKLILKKRIETQPYQEKSAGCMFRNPSRDLSAGALIDRCGLKGVKVGNAQVSELHANFLINSGRATSADVKALIELVRTRVYEKTQIFLDLEVRIL